MKYKTPRFSLMRTLLLLCIIAIVSCSPSSLKEVKEKDDNGRLVSKYSVHKESNEKHGVYTAYNEDGSLYEKAHYNQGRLDGTRTLFHSNGKVNIEEVYVSGDLSGDYKSYHENGQLKFHALYTKNVMSGMVKTFYESGKLKEEVTFVDNEENGPFIEFFENGNKKWEGNYHDGDNELGLLMKYDSTGQLIRKLECDSLYRCQTIWTIEGGEQEKVDINKQR